MLVHVVMKNGHYDTNDDVKVVYGIFYDYDKAEKACYGKLRKPNENEWFTIETHRIK